MSREDGEMTKRRGDWGTRRLGEGESATPDFFGLKCLKMRK